MDFDAPLESGQLASDRRPDPGNAADLVCVGVLGLVVSGGSR